MNLRGFGIGCVLKGKQIKLFIPYLMKESLTDFRDLTAFLNLLAQFRDEEASIYNAMAPGYDRFASAWDQSFARPALDALFAQLQKRTAKGGSILDAGCGTGRHVSDLLELLEPSELTGIDLSEAMLNMASRRGTDERVTFTRGNLFNLPFPDDSFDAVVAIWTVETLSHPGRAVQEFLRVIKPGGVVGYSFVQVPSHPESAEDALEDALLHASCEWRDELAAERLPFHDCDRSSLQKFRGGLISVATLGKCCSVDDRLLPAG